MSNCGCETPAELKTGCTLCPGGNDLIPDPLKEVIPLVTCQGIANVVERFEDNECHSYQQTIGSMCGCPDAPTSRLNGDETCRVCMDRPPDFPAGAVDLSELGLDGVPCAFFETIANQDEENPCELYQLQRGTCCTMPEVLPTAPANLAELCDADSVAADLGAFLACANACVEASCCEDSCSTNPVCFQYFPCLVLDSIEPPETDPTTTEGPPSPPSNLAELCDADSVAADPAAYLACASACIEASCCEDSCSTNSGCLQYFPCLVLGSVEPPEETDPKINGTTTEGEGTATSPPTQEQQGIEDTSGANNTSWVFFQILFSILVTMTAVRVAE